MIYGYELIINVKDCKNISRDSLKTFVLTLCKKIEMKRYGDCRIVYFGKDEFRGYSLLQFITTSSIVGHFTESEAFLNIFSCKKFDKNIVIDFVKDWFDSKKIKFWFIRR